MKKLIAFGVVVVLISLVQIFSPKSLGPELNEPERKPFLKASDKFHNELVSEYEGLKAELMKYSLNIPTWPDYIELDKDLEIVMPYKMWYGRMAFENFIFPKGTKIYFKDD